MLGLLGDVAEKIDVSGESFKVCLCHQSQHPAEVGALEQEERNSDMQRGLSPFSLKFI